MVDRPMCCRHTDDPQPAQWRVSGTIGSRLCGPPLLMCDDCLTMQIEQAQRVKPLTTLTIWDMALDDPLPAGV